MRISVIIATLGRAEILRKTLAAVRNCMPPPDEVLVVDGDPDRSAELVTNELNETGLRIRYLRSARGLTKQRNIGIDRAEGDVLVFIDDDVRVPSDVFSVLREVYADEAVVAATGRIVEPSSKRLFGKHSPARRFLPGGGGRDGTFTRYGYPRRLIDLNTERDIDFMDGSFMSVRTSIVREIRFDEALEGYALAEDEDFSYRVSRRGRIRFVPRIAIYHAKEGHGSRDPRRFGRLVVINRAYLFRKNFRRTPLARAQFAMLVAMLVGHRLVNRELREALGLLEGSMQVLLGSASKAPPRSKDRIQALRVTFVSSHSKTGGSETYLERLLDTLEDPWVHDLVALEEGHLVDRLRPRYSDVCVIPTSGRLPHLVAASLRLRRRLKQHTPDLVHANGIKAALVAGLATALSSTPVVWVKHDFSGDGLLARAIGARCRLIVSVSAAVGATFRGRQRRKVRVVHTGIPPIDVDRRTARKALLEAMRAPKNAVVAGLVGRLHPVKGHLDALDIAPRLLERRSRARLAFIGGEDASTRDYGELVRARAADLVNNGRVALLGHQNDALTLMAGLDVAIVPSGPYEEANIQGEGFPLVALELLAVGTPVIGYRAGGLPELVGDCGRLVPPGDKGALLKTLIELCDDSQMRARLASCGRQRVTDRFSQRSMLEKLESAYREAAA
jgi:glycosyltransferase involved in cell wall biosynthesis